MALFLLPYIRRDKCISCVYAWYPICCNIVDCEDNIRAANNDTDRDSILGKTLSVHVCHGVFA